ncbi:TOX high mobility group box family member 4-B [Takifugu rubripes]|uniref:TOX high mobility group box family member 4 a n=1 Tax=Takifugu rubripes TaxID=31033 RepID=H2SXE2_TAKRU|nr:TOX high mobility group box family member 4-B-like [Takifugu rubripes]|eukprot:XP_011617221.1 PREDICTED: TOX high mobility group box family member 4-B-like [Takifugu rubripes]
MDLNFYSELSGGSPSNVDSEYLNGQAFGGYPEENKFSESSDGYLNISVPGHHPFLSAATFHTPSLGDEDFEIPPISLDPDHTLNIGDTHFELSDGAGGAPGSRSLGSNLVVQANDPSFASTFVNCGSQGLEQINLGTMGQAVGGALMSSSALELGNSGGSHFSNSSPTTIDVHLGDIGQGLLESSHLSTINQSELVLGLGTENIRHHSGAAEQPLSATPSPANSLQDEEMDDFKRSVLVDSPMSLSSSATPLYMSSQSVPMSSTTTVKRGGAKQSAPLSVPGVVGNKKGRKKKDPNEPQKPVSAYALFFRDTQAAIKGQNPSASFGEVSKIVASMWDSLAEEQKQVYKRKTEAAKKEYLKALAAYKANQLSQPITDEMEAAPSSPTQMPNYTPAQQAPCPPTILEDSPMTSSCGSSIILNVPEMKTHFSTGTDKAAAPGAAAPPAKITKIIIPKHVLQAGAQLVTVLPGGVGTFQPTLLVSGASRQPPPLQQMQNAPPPPRLQQMAPAPPPLQAKPREGSAVPVLPLSLMATPPPPLQIKIVPASIQDKDSQPIIVPDTAVSSAASTSAQAAALVSGQGLISAVTSGRGGEVAHVLPSEEVEMEVNGSSDATPVMSICVREGCNNPAIESKEWDKEYCSNECVVTHCRDVFEAWCSIRNQTMGTVK